MAVSSLQLLLFALLPAAAVAQHPLHVYGGLNAQLPVSLDGYNTLTAVRPALTLGLQLSPRWALELDPLLYWRHSQGANSYVQNGGLYAYSYDDRSYTLVVPLLARLTLSKPDRRWLLEALGGVSWLQGWGRYQYSSITNGQVDYTYDHRYSSSIAALTLGPQVRYALTAQLAAKLNVPANFGLVTDGSFSQHLYFTPQLGVQYSFAK